MTLARALLLAAATGLNPWLTLLIIAGLATFTHRVPLAAPFAWLHGWAAIGLFGLLLAADVVVGKIPRLAQAVEGVNLVVVPLAGAAVAVALPSPLPAAAAALTGAAVAVALRIGRRRVTRAIDRPLIGYGHIVAGIAADGLAAIAATAGVAVAG